MKIRMLIAVPVAADEHGIRTRRLVLGTDYESSADWEADLFARLVEAGFAEEADKSMAPPETKAGNFRTRRRKR